MKVDWKYSILATIVLMVTLNLLSGCSATQAIPTPELESCDVRLNATFDACTDALLDLNQDTLDRCSRPGGDILEFVTPSNEVIYIECKLSNLI